jgi:hypothetical protein
MDKGDILSTAGITCPIYFTHAELLEIAPHSHNLHLRCMVMPANPARYQLEADTASELLWSVLGEELSPPSVDAGAIQLRDGTIRLGQLSRVLTDPDATVNATESEHLIRRENSKNLTCDRQFASHLAQVLGGIQSRWVTSRGQSSPIPRSALVFGIY